MKRSPPTRTFCAILSAVMLLSILTAFPVQADTVLTGNEAEPPPIEAAAAEETITSSESADMIELINATSGEIRLEKGQQYRIVHDDIDILYVSVYGSAVTVDIL